MQGLFEKHEYEFRVSAVNGNGQGPPLTGETPIIARMPFGNLMAQFIKIYFSNVNRFQIGMELINYAFFFRIRCSLSLSLGFVYCLRS